MIAPTDAAPPPCAACGGALVRAPASDPSDRHPTREVSAPRPGTTPTPGVSATEIGGRAGGTPPTGGGPFAGTARGVGPDAPPHIGRYEIAGELGRGGMGVVYRGFDPQLRRAVAIKVILDTSWAVDAEDLERFAREARVGARLRHPGIVTVLEVGQERGKPFIVMDFVEGESLESRLERERMSPRALAQAIREVALALHHAHAQGVVHRDVKPHNVLLDADGRAHLTDFGLAADTATIKSLTLTGDVIGTPAYMAPEQASGRTGTLGPPIDVWALGAVLYRGLTGAPPFEGVNALVTVQQVLTAEPEPPRQRDPTVHPDLETIALRCLEKEPALRYRSAQEVADELARFLAGEAIRARPLSRRQRLARWARRHPARVVAAGAIALLAIGLPIALAAQWSLAARAGARDARAALVAKAKGESEAAWERLEERRRLAATTGSKQSLLVAAHAALQAAARYEGVAAEGDDAARSALLRAQLALARSAIDTEQWTLARGMIEGARELDVRSDQVAALEADLTNAETRARADRRAAVEAIIARARAGELESEAAFEDALFALVRYPEPQTVGLLSAALTEVTEDIASEIDVAIDDLAIPRTGEIGGPIDADAARAAIAVVTRTGRLANARPEESTALGALCARSERRRSRGSLASLGSQARVLAVLADELEPALRPATVTLARLCCKALGRIGIDEGAVAALGDYVLRDPDDARAALAAIALARIGTAEAIEAVARGQVRFGTRGPFWKSVKEALPDLMLATDRDADRDEPLTADELIDRAIRRRSNGDRSGAFEDVQEARRLAPDDVDYLTFHARLLVDERRRAEALTLFDRTVKLAPGDARTWSNRGQIKADVGDLRGAHDDLRRALELDPRLVPAWTKLTKVLIRLGDPRGALDALDSAIANTPGEATLHVARAALRLDMGQNAEALADAKRAVTLAPGSAEALAMRALSLVALGEIGPALRDAEQAVKMSRESVDAWFALGCARRAAGDVGRAIVAFDAALHLEPDDLRCLARRGLAHAHARAFDAAIADLTRAIEIDPLRAELWNARGAARLESGAFEQAVIDLDRALKIDPTLAVAVLNRASALLGAGRHAEAARDFERFVEVAPHHPSAGAARDRLAKLRAAGVTPAPR